MGVYISKFDGETIDEKLNNVDQPFTSFEKEKLSNLINNNRVVYVDWVSGSEEGNGQKANPFKSIQRAVDSDAEIIYVKPGKYSEKISIRNKNNISIIPNRDESVEDEVICIGGTENDYLAVSSITIENSYNVNIINVQSEYVNADNFLIINSKNVTLESCTACHNNGYGKNGFGIRFSKCVLKNCKAYDIRNDGFSFIKSGVYEIINCKASECNYNGVSISDDCEAIVKDCMFFECGVAGIKAPNEGSSVTIENSTSYNNTYGLLCDKNEESSKSFGRVFSSVFKDNATDISLYNSEITAITTFYDVINKDESSAFNEFMSSGGDTTAISEALDAINGEVI